MQKFCESFKLPNYKTQQQTKNVDDNSNISDMKNSVVRITQNRQIVLFSLWSFNQIRERRKSTNLTFIRHHKTLSFVNWFLRKYEIKFKNLVKNEKLSKYIFKAVFCCSM